MSSLLRYTKDVYKSFKEDNGRYKLNPYSMIAKQKLGDRTNRFLSDYLTFVMNSNIVSEVTKAYITSIETKVSDVVAAYNLNNQHRQITSKQMHNHLYYDEKKLCALFCTDMLLNVLYKKADITVYETMLACAKNKNEHNSLLDKQSVLEVPLAFSSEVPTEEDFDQFFMLYAPYTKKMVKRVTEQLPMSVVGYLNYLSNKQNLTIEEEQYLERLELLDLEITIE